ncbi:MmcQ/YjbR family DNA-binding protein [Glycomyces albus]
MKVKGRFFARLRAESEGGLAIVCDPAEKAALLASGDGAYYTTPHYDGYAMILVNLEKIEPERLTEMVEDAWLIKAPVRVRKAFEESQS